MNYPINEAYLFLRLYKNRRLFRRKIEIVTKKTIFNDKHVTEQYQVPQ